MGATNPRLNRAFRRDTVQQGGDECGYAWWARGDGWTSTLTRGATVVVSAALLLGGCGGEDPVIVSGRVTSPAGNRTENVGLFLLPSDSLVAHAAVNENGTFAIRAKRTDEMKRQQAENGRVAFLVRGFADAGSSFCVTSLALYARFEHGRWIGRSGEPVYVDFRGVGKCE